MKTISVNKSTFILGLVALLLSACGGSRGFLSENFNNVKENHQRIGILPFWVQFQNPADYANKPDKRTQIFFSKQEQEASLDAQKELFMSVARQVQKGRYEIAFQDFNRTNKVLSENGIRIEDIRLQNKAMLAKLIGVDAIIFGELTVKISQNNNRTMPMMPNFRNEDGVTTDVKLFDAASGEILWSIVLSNRPTSQIDTPHRLSSGLISEVARNLPYRNK